MDFTYILLSQYPALFLLSLLALFGYLRARKASTVKSVSFVILFGVFLAAAVVCCFLGVQMKYWTLGSIASLNGWSWTGLAVLALLIILVIAHRIEAKLNRRKLDKAMKQAEKQKEAEVRRAREEAVNEERAKAAEAAAAAASAEPSDSDPLPTDVMKEML